MLINFNDEPPAAVAHSPVVRLGQLTAERAAVIQSEVEQQVYQPVYEARAQWMDDALSAAPMYMLRPGLRESVHIDQAKLFLFAQRHFGVRDHTAECMQVRYEVTAPGEVRILAKLQSLVIAHFLVMVINLELMKSLPASPQMPADADRTAQNMLRFLSQLKQWMARYGSQLFKVTLIGCDSGLEGEPPCWLTGKFPIGREQERGNELGPGIDTMWGYIAAS